MGQVGVNQLREGESSPFGRGDGGAGAGGQASSVAWPLAPPDTPPGLSPQLIRMICDLRRTRQDFFPANLSGDAAWDILLQLYAAHLDQHRVSISELTRRTSIAATTVLRWLGALTEEGLVSRSGDPNDSRRVFVALAPPGATAMNRYFTTSGTRGIFI
jgi:hypothetical protein